MEWQPIETYDALREKPQFAVFWVKATTPNRPGGHGLRAHLITERYYGLREVTHWKLLTPPKDTP